MDKASATEKRQYEKSGAEAFGLSFAEFSELLLANRKAGSERPDDNQIRDLVLAHSCAAGNEFAWESFLCEYKPILLSAARSICGDHGAAEELVTLLLGDLFGTTVDATGKRRSKLSLYTGRGRLSGWLRATLAQLSIDRHRVQRRFITLEEALPSVLAYQSDGGKNQSFDPRLGPCVEEALRTVSPESRLLLKAYYLDQMTLAEIARLTGIHESTVSRRAAKAVAQLRRMILQNLTSCGMSLAEARQMLKTDVRYVSADIEGALAVKAV